MLNIDVVQNDLASIKQMIDRRDLDTAGKALNAYLSDHPDDTNGLYLLGLAMYEANQAAAAKLVFQHLTKKEPERYYHWFQLARCWDWLTEPKKAEQCFLKALKRTRNAEVMVHLSSNYVMQGNIKEALRYANMTLDLEPHNGRAHSNKGFAYLLDRDYGKGWPEYEAGLGYLMWRDERRYHESQRWKGETDGGIVVYTEQGLGDEIAGAEIMRDMVADYDIIALDCTAKMRNLFARSFPDIAVHGTNTKKDLSSWGPTPDIVYSASVFNCHTLLRKTEDDYKKEPFLVADPQRRVMWRALLDSLGPGLKVGIAWSGGISLTQKAARRAVMDDLMPILSQDCVFVDLEYKDRSEDLRELEGKWGVKVHSFPWATRTNDYDDTAALVAELDLVISVPTAVTHLAGGLGTECWCMTHPRPHYHYAMHGDTMPYYGSVKLYRRESDNDWLPSVKAVAADLKELINGRDKLQHPEDSDRRLAGSG